MSDAHRTGIAHRRRRSSPAAPAGRERGAVLVEMAIVGMFLVTLMAGTYDFGQAWRGGLATTEAVRAGARVGSSAGVDGDADLDLLLSARAALQSSGMLDGVQRVVVFRSGTTGVVPATCKTATATVNGCNILTGAQFKALAEGAALEANGCIKASISKGFCPTNRNDIPLQADSVGVWIRSEYTHFFKVLGNVQTIERTAVMRIEPRTTDSTG